MLQALRQSEPKGNESDNEIEIEAESKSIPPSLSLARSLGDIDNAPSRHRGCDGGSTGFRFRFRFHPPRRTCACVCALVPARPLGCCPGPRLDWVLFLFPGVGAFSAIRWLVAFSPQSALRSAPNRTETQPRTDPIRSALLRLEFRSALRIQSQSQSLSSAWTSLARTGKWTRTSRRTLQPGSISLAGWLPD